MSRDQPTTAEVREAYQSTGDGLDFKHRFFERGAEFDRWLAEECRAAAEKAWDDAMTFIYANAWVSLDPGKAPVENPYRAKETKA